MRHFAGFAKFCGCQFLIRHSRIRQVGVLKCFDPGLFFLAPTLYGSFFLQTCLLCPLFFLLAFLPHCSLLCNDHLTVRLGSSLERRQGKYEKCDNSNGCGQPAPRNPAFRLLRFVLLRRRRKRKRRFFRNWFDFKRSWLLRRRLRHRRFYWYGRHLGRSFFVLCWLDGRGFLLRKCRLLRFPEHKLRLFRRIWRILRAANKNVRHAAGFLCFPVSNRNDHKITDCKRQSACQIGVWTSAVFELHLTELIISAACRFLRRCRFLIKICPRFGFFLRFLILVIFFCFFGFLRQTN